jgi:hypothetical protein
MQRSNSTLTATLLKSNEELTATVRELLAERHRAPHSDDHSQQSSNTSVGTARVANPALMQSVREERVESVQPQMQVTTVVPVVLGSGDYDRVQSIAHQLCEITRFKPTPERIMNLRDPGSYNEKEKKVTELKWSQKYSAKGTTSLLKHLNELSQHVAQVNVKPGVYVTSVLDGTCLLAPDELKTWRAQLHIDPEVLARYQGEETGTDEERKQYQTRCRGIVLYLYWRLCELFNTATPASVIHQQIRNLRVTPCNMSRVPETYMAVLHLWNQLQHTDKCLAAATETESLRGHMEAICLNSGATDEEGRSLRDALSNQFRMAKQNRDLEIQAEKIAEITNPSGGSKKDSNSDEARRLQLAFASTKGESLQTEEDRILTKVIRKIVTDTENAAKTRNTMAGGVNNVRGRQDSKGANGDKSDGSRSTSRDRDRNRHRQQGQAKKSVPPDSLISSAQELEDQEQDRLNQLAADRVLQAASSVQQMQNHLASQQLFLSEQVSRIPEGDRKPSGHRNVKEVTSASTQGQGRYGPGGGSTGNTNSNGSGYPMYCKSCGSTLHRGSNCPYVYSGEEAAKFNKDMAAARGRSTEHPEEVLQKGMLNWDKFADSIIGASNPTQDLETKMKFMATTFAFRVTPNPDRTRPYEQEKNDNFAKLKAYVLQRMSSNGTATKKK